MPYINENGIRVEDWADKFGRWAARGLLVGGVLVAAAVIKAAWLVLFD